MCVIFPGWGGVQQSAPCWTVKLYFEALRKQQVMFPFGKPLSGQQPADKPLNTIEGHLEIYLATPYYTISYEACPSLLGIITRIPKKPQLRSVGGPCQQPTLGETGLTSEGITTTMPCTS